jgi:hypothetical protein
MQINIWNFRAHTLYSLTAKLKNCCEIITFVSSQIQNIHLHKYLCFKYVFMPDDGS